MSRILRREVYATGVLAWTARPETDEHGDPLDPPDGASWNKAKTRWVIPITVPKIVSLEQHKHARDAIEARSCGRKDDYVEGEAVFRGVAVCGECGSPMMQFRQPVKGAAAGYRWYYRCSGTRSRIPEEDQCSNRRSYRMADVDAKGWEILLHRANMNAKLPALVGFKGGETSWDAERKRAEEQLVGVEAEHERAVRLLLSATPMTAAVIHKRIEELEAERHRLEARVTDATTALADQAAAARGVRDMVKRLRKLTRHLRHDASFKERRRVALDLLGNGQGQLVLGARRGPGRDAPYTVAVRCAALPRTRLPGAPRHGRSVPHLPSTRNSATSVA